MITWTADGIKYRADQRHVEVGLREVGLDESSKPISTPMDLSSRNPRCRAGMQKSIANYDGLNPSAMTRYRGIVALMNFLGQDRPEIQFAVKELGKEMSSPPEASWTCMKRLLRYLKGAPRAILSFGY